MTAHTLPPAGAESPPERTPARDAAGAGDDPPAGGTSDRDWCPECDAPVLITDDSTESLAVPFGPAAPLVRVIRFDCGHAWEGR